MKPPISCVYVLKGWRKPEWYKIGATRNLHQRYNAKSTRDQIVVILESDEPFALEGQIHQHFVDKRMDGYSEIFALDDNDIETLRNWHEHLPDEYREGRNVGHDPIQCPRCKSINWNRPKVEKREDL